MIFERIIELLQSITGALRGNSVSRWRQEDIYESSASKHELVEPLREGTGTRKREVHAIGPWASSDGVGWDKERVEYVDGQRVQTTVEYSQARRCDCGAVLAYQNYVLGTCRICSRVVCKHEGCAARCDRCGALVCTRHCVHIGEHTFCTRHRAYGLWMRFWGVLK